MAANTYAILQHSKAALVTSGTATLETALLNVPEIVCYKGNPITLALAKRFVKIKFIALVNLIMDKEVVKELIQEDLTTKQLSIELKKLLEDPAQLNQVVVTSSKALVRQEDDKSVVDPEQLAAVSCCENLSDLHIPLSSSEDPPIIIP